MIIYFGADHRGFDLKEYLKEIVVNEGYEIIDCGDKAYDEKDDYTDFASEVGKNVAANPSGSRGIVICGSGAGVDVVTNKFKGVRGTLAISADQIYDARHDDDINVLSLSADFTEKPDAEKIIKVFLETPFGGEERHRRRLEKISQIENG